MAPPQACRLLLTAAVVVLATLVVAEAAGTPLDYCPKGAADLMPYIPPKAILQQRRAAKSLYHLVA